MKLTFKGKQETEFYEDEHGTTYRYSNGSWEELMGESWEHPYTGQEVELDKARKNDNR